MTVIMVMDNAPAVREMLTVLLTEEGYDVRTTDFAAGRLADVQAIMPDALILDGLFPDPSACLALLYALRSLPTSPHIPIIVCTTAIKHAQELADTFWTLDVQVMLKPFEIGDLLLMLKKGLG